MSSGKKTPNTEPSTSKAVTEQTTEPKTEGEASASAMATGSSGEYIRLRVITSDMTNEVHFRVKTGTALGRLKRSYCSKLGFQSDELRFVFEGQRITDDDTPTTLGMINDDVIEIYQERTGGM